MNAFSWISFISGFLALVLNIYLVPLIVFYSSQNIGSYKYLLLVYTITSVIYTVAQLATLPTFHVFSGGYLFHSTATYTSRLSQTFSIVTFASTFALIEIVICLSFLYRYGILCNPHVMEYFKPGKRLAFMIFTSVISMFVLTKTVIGISPNDFVDQHYRNESLVLLGKSTIDYAYIGGPIFLPSGDIYWNLMNVILTYSLLTFFTSAIELFCIVRMLRTFRSAAQWTTTIGIQKKLFTLLILQAFFPFVFNGTPLMFVYFTSLFNLQTDIAPQFLGAVMSVAQVLDPILVVAIIGDYRRVLFRMMNISDMKLHSWISLISGSSACCLNLLLIPIIIGYSSKSLGHYKYFLLLYSLTALMYSGSQVIALPTFHSFPGGYAFYSTVDFLPYSIRMPAVVVFTLTFAQNLIIICLSFMYRYSILCGGFIGSLFQKKWKLTVIAFISLTALLVLAYTIIEICSNDFVNGLYKDLYENYLNQTAAQFAYVGGPLLLPEGGFYWPPVICNLCYTTVVTTTVVIEAICIRKILRALKELDDSSRKRHEKRIFTLLILQTSFPFVFNGFPILIITSFSILGVTVGPAMEFIGAGMSIAQIVDPFLMFIYISDYKKGLLKLLGIQTLQRKMTLGSSSNNRSRSYTDRNAVQPGFVAW